MKKRSSCIVTKTKTQSIVPSGDFNKNQIYQFLLTEEDQHANMDKIENFMIDSINKLTYQTNLLNDFIAKKHEFIKSLDLRIQNVYINPLYSINHPFLKEVIECMDLQSDRNKITSYYKCKEDNYTDLMYLVFLN